MIYLLIVLALIILVILSLLFIKAKVILEYNKGYFRVIFRSGLIRFSIDSDKIDKLTSKRKDSKKEEKPEEEKKPDGEEKSKDEIAPHEKFFDKVNALKEKYLSLKTVANIFLRCVRYKINFSEIYIRVHYGTGDAPSTGMLYGAVWALIGNVYAFICRYFYMSFPEVDLDADYNKKVFEAELKGIITVRPVHIIIAVLRSLKAYRNHKKSKKEK